MKLHQTDVIDEIVELLEGTEYKVTECNGTYIYRGEQRIGEMCIHWDWWRAMDEDCMVFFKSYSRVPGSDNWVNLHRKMKIGTLLNKCTTKDLVRKLDDIYANEVEAKALRDKRDAERRREVLNATKRFKLIELSLGDRIYELDNIPGVDIDKECVESKLVFKIHVDSHEIEKITKVLDLIKEINQ